jgi:flagellar motility protein MotE (MotC chaperone)
MPRGARILPVVIFVAALSLTLKVGGMWHDLGVQFRASVASEPAGNGAKPKPEKPAQEAPHAQGAGKPEGAATGQGAPDAAKAAKNAPPNGETGKGGEKEGTAAAAGAGTKPGADAEAPGGKAPGTFDPLNATDAEIELLGKLASRREELERRSAEIDLRESVLQAAERRLDQKVAELKSIKSTIESLLKKHDAEEEAKLKSLVKIYESMKPKDAARILERLELPILLDVLERMREAKVAPILADMDPAKAKTVTAALAERRNLPRPQADAGAEPSSLRPN